MVIVKLMGGLGNQLFQYAAGKALALKHNAPLKVDVSFLQKNPNGAHTKRELELSSFHTHYEIASADDISVFYPGSLIGKLARKFAYRRHRGEILKERSFAYDDRFSLCGGNAFLDGYWQSERYFSNIRRELLDDLRLRHPLNEPQKHMEKQIENAMSVSLHIRRGDYVSNANANAFHGVLPISYYQKSLGLLSKRVGNLRVFVFSDDGDWAKANLSLEHESIFIGSDNKNYIDLHLMRKCTHHIIANSSFSWWAAWLNDSKEKIVIAPKPWFAEKSINTKDLLPERWMHVGFD